MRGENIESKKKKNIINSTRMKREIKSVYYCVNCCWFMQKSVIVIII